MIKIEEKYDPIKYKDEIYDGSCDNCGIRFSCCQVDLSSVSKYWAGSELRVVAFCKCPSCGYERIMQNREKKWWQCVATAVVLAFLTVLVASVIALTKW